MPFGQVVIGPPGSGKTTYCRGMHEFLSGIERKIAVVNLDPANEDPPYQIAVDIKKLITLDDAMAEESLGPNGGMIYCLEYLAENLSWLENELAAYSDCYILFDCPGQVELYTNNDAVKKILDYLTKLNFRLVAVHLVDSQYCTDLTKYVSVLLVSLKTMLQLELPHINVLSKIDLMDSYGTLDFTLEYYTEVMDLSQLVMRLDEKMGPRYHKLTEALCNVIEEFGLVNFHPLMIEDKISMVSLVRLIDKAGGYIYGTLAPDNQSIQEVAVQVPHTNDVVQHMQQTYLKND